MRSRMPVLGFIEAVGAESDCWRGEAVLAVPGEMVGEVALVPLEVEVAEERREPDEVSDDVEEERRGMARLLLGKESNGW